MKPARFLLLPLLLCAVACDQDEASSSFRSASLDISVQLAQASEGGSDDGTIVWEIVEAAATTASEGGSDDGTIVWEIVEFDAAQTGHVVFTVDEQHTQSQGGSDDGTVIWEIVEAKAGATVCRVKAGKLFDANGKTRLFVADDVVSDSAGPVLRFADTDVLDGYGKPVLSADADLSAASSGRQLTIAALVTGVCN